MSGIVASHGPIDPAAAGRMLERIAHRGADHRQALNVAGNWLGCRWSSSPKSASRPFTSDGGDLKMVADGEIYNVAGQSIATDPAAASISIVLDLFARHGAEAFASLDGPFAIVIAGDDGRFVAARDRYGLSPLYWARTNDHVLFASELQAFDGAAQPHVECFPPGHVWTADAGLWRFIDSMPERLPATAVDKPANREDIHASIREHLVASVEEQMMEDTEVVAFLSGGLDSSLIAAIANRWMNERGERLKTFAVGTKDSPDIQAARTVADELGTDHHEKTYTTAEALETVPEVVRSLEHFDPSLVRSSVSNYILAEFAAREADVALTGEGSDELFAGYSYLRDLDSGEALHAELLDLLSSMHKGGLQRVDRTSTVHGLTVRLPFLANRMVDMAMRISPELKRIDQGQVEKRLLREAFEGWLPDTILWRTKAQFGDGSGAVDALQEAMAATVSPEAFQQEQFDVDPPLRSFEEVAYYRMYATNLGETVPGRVLGRFATV